MSDKTYNEDLQVIEAATPGPWDFGYYNICSKEEAMELAGLDYEATKDSVGVRPQGFGAFIPGTSIKTANCGYSDGKSEENARFIAHFNPTKCRELVEGCQQRDERIAELEANNARLRGRVKQIFEHTEYVNQPEPVISEEEILGAIRCICRASVTESPADSLAAVRRDVVEKAHMAGQFRAGVDPGYSIARAYADGVLGDD